MKKKKKVKLSTLRKKLEVICNRYIRLRDKGICFTCGAYAEGSAYHAGHYIPKSICGIDLRYDQLNIHGQCYRCNIHLGGYGAMYEQNMRGKYGNAVVDALWAKKTTGKKWYEKDFLEKIAYYENLLRGMD